MKWKVVVAPVENMVMACSYAVSLASGQVIPPDEFGKRFNVSERRDEAKRKLVTRADLSASFITEARAKHAKDFALHDAALQKGWLSTLPHVS